MSTIPGNRVRGKTLASPFKALRGLPPDAGRVLVGAALRASDRRGDLVPLLEAAGLLLARGPGQARRRRTLLWPHRVDEGALRLELCCAVLAHWALASEAARRAFFAVEEGLTAAAILRLVEREPAAAGVWLAENPGRATLEMLTRLVLSAEREASTAAAGMLAGRVVGALGLGREEVVGADLARLAVGEADGTDLTDLLGRVADLVARYEEHQQRDIMAVGLLLAEGPGRTGGEILGRLAGVMEVEQAGTAGMRAALRRGKGPFVRVRAWRWLAAGPVRVASIDRLARVGVDAEHEAVLSAGYLVLRPVRARALRMIKVRARGAEAAGGEALPSMRVRERLGPVSRRWLIDFAGGMQAPEAVTAGLRQAGLTDPSPWVRWAHQRTATPGEQADYAFDADGRVARSAALARSPAGGRAWVRRPLRRPDEVRLRLTESLARSPHEHVRSVARSDGRRMNPWLVDLGESRLAAREWLRADRAGFVAALRARVEGGDEGERVATLRLVRLLRLGVTLETVLVDIAGGGRAGCRAAATAVAALGDLSTPGALVGVRAALGSGDERVRANAVEASLRRRPRGGDLADSDGVLYGSLIELKTDGHHRVRANALRGLIEGCGTGRGGRLLDPGGVDGLESMLGDGREMHRLAGLWLAERTLVAGGRDRLGGSWDAICRRVAAMAARDEEAAVRTRAQRCAKRLLAEIQNTVGGGKS